MKYFYVYRITDTLLSKFYYGSRSSTSKPQDDIGIRYYSSSMDSEFLEMQLKYPK